MSLMFGAAAIFNSDISQWDVSNVIDMSWMFNLASSFNGDISNWDVRNVANMSFMFHDASSFNGDLSQWDVSNVTDMESMFTNAVEFNGEISQWDVSNVTNMHSMFLNANSFNANISNWNVGNVTNMTEMFSNARKFNGDLSNWNIAKVTNMANMLDDSGLSRSNYDLLLVGWLSNGVSANVNFGATGIKYCNGASARQELIDNHGWTITDGGRRCSQTIDFPFIPTKKIEDADFELTATASSELPITYTSSDESVATVSGNIVSIKGVGTTTITALQDGDDAWEAAEPVSQPLIVKQSQEIIFAPLSAKTVDDSDFELSATASSGLPITFSSSDESVATISGNIVSINGEGSTIITASQDGNDTWEVANPVTQELLVQNVTGISRNETKGIKIYPNPTNDHITLEVDGIAIRHISLYDVHGKKLFEHNGMLEKIDISQFTKGLYFLHINSSGTTSFHKVIKK